MQRKESSRLNDQGSTMIITVIAIVFISILSTLLLTITVNSIQMKKVNQTSKKNFYSAEIALDEVKAGLEEVTASALETSYDEVMKQYIGITIAQKKSIFSTQFVNQIAYLLGGDVNADRYSLTLVGGYIKNPGATLMTDAGTGENVIVKDTRDALNPQYIMLKNVQIDYVESNHYKTSISLDIKIRVPDFNLNFSTSGKNTFEEYGTIADNGIVIQTAQNTAIRGNVYAGSGGISLDNASSLLMEGATHIVTRGDITVAGTSALQILSNPQIWAKNIKTTSGSIPVTDLSTALDITGKCYVANDMMLNAKNSKVTVSGEYYGYGNEAVPERSSAVILNGAKSSLDLKGVNRLLIAGRAYLDPTTAGNTDTGNVAGKVLTGESLAVKGNQYAYLVPTECLWRDTDSNPGFPKNVANPVPREKYLARLNNTDGLTGNPAMVTLTAELLQYADGYTTVFYKNGTRDEVFFFLKFKSQDAANQYLKHYYEKNKNDTGSNSMYLHIKSFAKNIEVNSAASTIISPAGLLTYVDEAGMGLKSNSSSADGSALQYMKESFLAKYGSLTTELKEMPSGMAFDPTSVFRTMVDTTKITGNAEWVIDGAHRAYVADGAFATTDGMQGVLIARGDVTVNGTFTGLILSGGTVTLTNGAKILASKEVVNTVLNAKSGINEYFKNLVLNTVIGGAATGNTKVVVPELIDYVNWKMNED